MRKKKQNGTPKSTASMFRHKADLKNNPVGFVFI